jgi:hypothetical protein
MAQTEKVREIQKAQAIKRAVFATFMVLLVGSLAPIWVVWSISRTTGFGQPGTLWHVLWQLPSNASQLTLAELLRFHWLNLIYLAVLAPSSVVVGWLVYRRKLIRASQCENAWESGPGHRST